MAQSYLTIIAKQAYLQRQKLHLMVFANNQVTSLFAKQRLPKEFGSIVSQLRYGGGTPLQQAIDETEQLAKKIKYRHPHALLQLTIVTDGRVNEQLLPLKTIDSSRIIDVEQGEVRFGRAQQLAQQLQADYVRG